MFIVSTPIGNLQDVTQRALDTLKSADLIVCEDTRVTGNLLHHFEIKKEMVSMNDANEDQRVYEVIEKLQSGINIALVSDSGTPLISDPGFRLVRECVKKGIQVIPIPGANAITTALSASGLPTDKFLFMGFCPDSFEHKKKFFLNIKNTLTFSAEQNIKPTVLFFESPHKLLKSLEAFLEVFGDIEIVAAREMTKIHEEFLKDTASNLLAHFTKNPPKGEFVILFHP